MVKESTVPQLTDCFVIAFRCGAYALLQVTTHDRVFTIAITPLSNTGPTTATRAHDTWAQHTAARHTDIAAGMVEVVLLSVPLPVSVSVSLSVCDSMSH